MIFERKSKVLSKSEAFDIGFVKNLAFLAENSRISSISRMKYSWEYMKSINERFENME